MDFSQITGALAYQHVQALLTAHHVFGAYPEHIQPSSLDTSISDEVYRMRGSYLPKTGERIRSIIREGALYRTSLNLPLELNGIYYIRLNETCVLPSNIYAYANNKSSTGRINLQTRLIVDGVSEFDAIPQGYAGELWLEVIPKSFPVKLVAGERLNQIRFLASDTRLSAQEHATRNGQEGFLFDAEGNSVFNRNTSRAPGVTMTIDLTCGDIVGYCARATSSRVLEYARRDHVASDFFEPIMRPKNGEVTLHHDNLYIFLTKEGIRVPPAYAVEMAPYDVGKGEFRSHYAGFFDPGWGCTPNDSVQGMPAVLEVLANNDDFILRDGQPICSMVYEKLSAIPDVCYGDAQLASNYFQQRVPKLSKHFAS